jgi:hypothetical protein
LGHPPGFFLAAFLGFAALFFFAIAKEKARGAGGLVGAEANKAARTRSAHSPVHARTQARVRMRVRIFAQQACPWSSDPVDTRWPAARD